MNLGFWNGIKETQELGLKNSGGYSRKIRALNPIRYWPLWDVAGSPSAIELITGDNGVPSNVTFGATGVGDGRTSASFDGSASYIDIYSAALVAAFDGANGTVAVWLKVSAAGVWADGTSDFGLRLYVDANNSVTLYKDTAANTLTWLYRANGNNKAVSSNAQGAVTTWFHMAMTWDKGADEMKAFYGGSQVGSTQTGLQTFTGSLGANTTLIGCSNKSSPSSVWNGYEAHVVILDKTLAPAQVATLAAL